MYTDGDPSSTSCLEHLNIVTRSASLFICVYIYIVMYIRKVQAIDKLNEEITDQYDTKDN